MISLNPYAALGGGLLRWLPCGQRGHWASRTEVPGLAVQCSRPRAGPRGGRGVAGRPERWGRAPAARMPSPPGPELPRRIPRRARAGRRNNGQPAAAGSPVPEAGCGPPRRQHCANEAPAPGTEINGGHRWGPVCRDLRHRLPWLISWDPHLTLLFSPILQMKQWRHRA